jgi:hypothetical protein
MNYRSADPLNLSPFRTYLSARDMLRARHVYSRSRTAHGFMIQSDGDRGLAVRARGGAVPGSVLELDSACTSTKPDCTWTYERGMLVSDEDPTLAIQAHGEENELRLASTTDAGTGGVTTCRDDPSSCQWSYRGGAWLSLAAGRTHRSMSVRSGAVHGARLVTTNGCRENDPDCTWTLPAVLLQNHRDTTLAVAPTNGSVDGSKTRLSSACDLSNTECSWRFSHGLLESSRNPALALTAFGGASEGANVILSTVCARPGGGARAACTWTWAPGGIFSDDEPTGTPFCLRPAGGPLDGANLQLTAACGQHDGDGVFMGRFATEK